MSRLQQLFAYFQKTGLQPLNMPVLECIISDECLTIIPERSQPSPFTHYSEVDQLPSGPASAVMPAPAHLHSILLNCTPARSNRHRISIFSRCLLNKPRFITKVPKECKNQQYITSINQQ